MPVYSYRCENCDHRFEVRQRMSDRPLSDCPVCHGQVRRVVNSVGIVFKGSGFYVTDNRNGSGPNGSKKAAENAKETSEEKSSNAESKDTDTGDGKAKSEVKKKATADSAT